MRIWLILFLLFFAATAPAQNHLLISEIQVAPDNSEFIEIYNPNPVPISLNNIYLSDYNTYYEMVNNVFSSGSGDFLVKFPAGSEVDSSGVVVVALNGSGFPAAANFEIISASAVPDMEGIYVGSSASLSNSEMIILFQWDGSSDLVQDIDYVMWNTTSSNFVDKSGISIDGPDPDSQVSTYQNDTSVGSQQPYLPYPFLNNSIIRLSVLESGEIPQNGNGLSGHDETSEPIASNFESNSSPSPGTTNLQIPSANGSGNAFVMPDSVRADSTVDLTFKFKGTLPDTLTTFSLEIPADWSWSGSSADLQLSAAGFASASASVQGNVITISNTAVNLADSGVVVVSGLTSPTTAQISVFEVKTAIAGGTLTPIGQPPAVTVWKPVALTSIADIQNNTSAYLGQQVTIEGIVTLGAGRTVTTRTDTYVQDESGSGINVFSFDPPSTAPNDLLERGNRVRITGTVEEYQGVTEITGFTAELLSTGNDLPAPEAVSTQQAANTALEGKYLQTKGVVTDFAPNIGGGTNIRIDDGSGEALIRVWDDTGLDLSGITLGDSLQVSAVMDIYMSEAQLIPGYQEDLGVPGSQPGDGSGTADISPDSVGISQQVSETITISGEIGFTLETIRVTVPTDWGWNGQASTVNLSGAGFAAAAVQVVNRTITVSGAEISETAAGTIEINQLTSPAFALFSTFPVKTAVSGGTPGAIGESPVVQVGKPGGGTPIALIQQNPAAFSTVTIEGVVTLGAGRTVTTRSDAYVQDGSGRGINVFSFDPPSTPPNNLLERGNLLRITGTVEEYQGTTEITGFTAELLSSGNPLPKPLQLSTS
ncbi:MAG: hypothetical protein WAN36_09005, partial [Calditrichia bacterium]